MKLLILCPIPVEYAACREALALRDAPRAAGCRAARGAAAGGELFAVECGPGKARAASAAAAGIVRFEPDLVLDTGSCAGIEPGAVIGEIVSARNCYEADISGTGFPNRTIPEMRLPAAFEFLPAEEVELLQKEMVERGEAIGARVRLGNQVCGEFLIHSVQMRGELYRLFQAAGGNWETAGVFVAALKNSLPALSLRVITDLGTADALRDFRRNVKPRARELYRYLAVLLEYGWFERFHESWSRLERSVLDRLPSAVLP